ncbi:hypothetical protein IGI04_035988 [Brassica rapa subsp. trilocularis]|uniref:Uncharacterized protein n=1 Tax=Brassica rapa subsp. trilocularis TaxID=1813537 RepID=A0ABQ7LDC0_BRACM|nr:hypothetical protein IGI04_035988 [Brassica rapa subsp. trilocularis]
MTLWFTFWTRKPFGYCPGSSEPDRCTAVTIKSHVFFTTQAKSGSTIVLRISRWSGKMSSGTMTLRFMLCSRKPFGYCPGSSEPDRCTAVTIRTLARLSRWSAG